MNWRRAPRIKSLLWSALFFVSACGGGAGGGGEGDGDRGRTQFELARNQRIVRVIIIGPTVAQPGHCTEYQIAFLDQENRSVALETETKAVLSGLIQGDGLYADPLCRDELDPTDITLGANQAIAQAYVRPGSGGLRNIHFTLDNGVFATIDVRVGDMSDEPASMVLTLLPAFPVSGDTVIVFVSLLNQDGEPALAPSGGYTLTLGTQQALLNGRFCEDPDCESPLPVASFHLPEGEAAEAVFYQPNIDTPSMTLDIEVGGPSPLQKVSGQISFTSREPAGLLISGGPVAGFEFGQCSDEKIRVTLLDDNGQPMIARSPVVIGLFHSDIEIRDNCSDAGVRVTPLEISVGQSYVEFVVTPKEQNQFEILALDLDRWLLDTKVFSVGPSGF